MDMVEERLSKEWAEDKGIDIMEERPSNHRSKVKGMDIVEDMTTEMVERKHEGVVLTRG
jgi:hypothetical protein